MKQSQWVLYCRLTEPLQLCIKIVEYASCTSLISSALVNIADGVKRVELPVSQHCIVDIYF